MQTFAIGVEFADLKWSR